MWEQMTRIGIPMNYTPHFTLMKALVAKTSFHMYTNEYPELQTLIWFNSNFSNST
jgi:hypothetical protein